MAINFLQNVDLNKGEIQNVALQNAGTNPGTPATGQIYFNTGDNTLRVYNGTSWDTYSTTTGDITGVTAGTGLTGGGASGAVTLNVIGGDGITANADDVAITPAQTTITSVLNTSLVLGRDADNQIKFGTDNQIIFRVGAGDGVIFKASGEIEATKFDGALEGNADTATALATARAINGVDFDGTAAITVTAAAGTLTGSTLNSGVTASSLTSLGTIATGVWNGTAIASAYLDADTAHLSTTQTFTGAKTFTGTLALTGTGRITGVDTVSDSTDAASKGYVDGLTFDDVSNANLLTALANLESSGGAANENIVIGTDSGDTIVIAGNLQVQGTTTTVDSTTVAIGDNNIVLGKDNATSAPIDGAGITIEGGTGDDVGLKWVAASTQFNLFKGAGFADLVAFDTEVKSLTINGVLVTSTPNELNTLDGYTGSVTEFNYLRDLYNTGVTSTEFDYLDGVTSNIQTQLDAKAASGHAADVGGATSVTITHGLGTRDVVVQLYDNSTYDTVYADTIRLDTNNVRFLFRTAPSAAAYRCVITRI